MALLFATAYRWRILLRACSPCAKYFLIATVGMLQGRAAVIGAQAHQTHEQVEIEQPYHVS